MLEIQIQHNFRWWFLGKIWPNLFWQAWSEPWSNLWLKISWFWPSSRPFVVKSFKKVLIGIIRSVVKIVKVFKSSVLPLQIWHFWVKLNFWSFEMDWKTHYTPVWIIDTILLKKIQVKKRLKLVQKFSTWNWKIGIFSMQRILVGSVKWSIGNEI